MKLKIIGVGSHMPDWVASGFEEYRRRLPKAFHPQLVEIPLARRHKNQTTISIKEKEGAAILKKLDQQDYVVALDILGQSINTTDLADKLLKWQEAALNISILIGGPNGISDSCLSRADLLWSLSDLTLPHTLVRVLIMEQIYRAWSINIRHPYHRC